MTKKSAAAKTIQSAWRNYKSKKTPATVAQVKAIVKREVGKTEETKSYYTSWASLMYDNLITSVNPFYPLSQGVGSENVVGEKIYCKNFKASGFIYNAIASSTGNRCMVRMALIHSRDKLHLASQSNITPSDIFRPNGSTYRVIDSFDYHKVRVLKEQSFTIDYSLGSQVIHKPFQFQVDFNKVMTFDGDSSGYFKDGQYFFVIFVYDGRGTGSNYWGAKFNTAVNYKDA